MRPLKLIIEGFASFRERTEIDFEGVDLFALTGATGAGKSSILDAMVFCLYGTVPRYDRKNAVAPAISQTKNEAKLRLDFSVGERRFTAVRVVRRSGNGATTKEARLESDGERLAGTADELSTRVAEILGLNFDQFTRCVLLPQGEFAQFLHDGGSDKNELIRTLMGLDIYRKLADLAGQEASALTNQVSALSGRLAEFAGDTPEARDQFLERGKALDQALSEIEARLPRFEEIKRKGTELREQQVAAAKAAETLEGLREPAGVREQATELAQLEAKARSTAEAVEAASQKAEAAESALTREPKVPELIRQTQVHREHAGLVEECVQLEAELKAVQKQERTATALLEVAQEKLGLLERKLTEMRSMNAAYHLSTSLTEGDRCPVCGSDFHGYPDEAPEDLQIWEGQVAQARLEVDSAKTASDKVARLNYSRSEALGRVQVRLQAASDAVAECMPLAELHETLARVEKLTAEAESARSALTKALELQRQSSRALDGLRTEEQAARNALQLAIQSVAIYEPPVFAAQNLPEGWDALLKWAREKATELREHAAVIGAQTSELRGHYEAVDAELRQIAADYELAWSRDGLRDTCVKEADRAHREAERITARIGQAATLRAEELELRTRRDTFQSLRQHLQTNRFEAWVLNRSFQTLCEAASQKLKELSRGQYSITVSEKNEFEILDHTNADERRSARTLSGGETFLASLSLALSLAEQVAMRGGAYRLESLFLDEGFGTLDPETLDTVAAAVEDLGASGRMIGVVTHVREFADRLPVRYEVRKDVRGSKVEKVVA